MNDSVLYKYHTNFNRGDNDIFNRGLTSRRQHNLNLTQDEISKSKSPDRKETMKV